MKFFVIYKNDLSQNKNFLFKLNKFKLKKNEKLYSHLANHNMSHVQFKNDFLKPILIKKRVILGKFTKFNENECYIANANQNLVLIVKNKKTIHVFSHEMKKHISHFKNKKKSEFKNDKNKIKSKHKNSMIRKKRFESSNFKIKIIKTFILQNKKKEKIKKKPKTTKNKQQKLE